MSLNSATLQVSLATLFSGAFVFPGEVVGRWPVDKAECAYAWTKCYADYAATAQSCQGVNPSTLVSARATMQSALLLALDTIDPASCASAIAAAMTAFWLTPPIVFTGATAGLVSSVTGTAALQSTLILNWASNVAAHISAQDAATQHASVFDTFTKTVIVAHIAPGACSAPLA